MQSPFYDTITADEAKKMIDEGNVTVVDVRTQAEYDEAHLPGALCVPLDTIGSEKIAELPDDEPLLVYCRTGVRSKLAAEKLAAIGYARVYDLGGIRDWPYETEHSE